MKKKPRFFCDNCNTEVARNTKTCPRCGRFFALVRCPACGYTGEDGSFTGGCPVCGYSAPPDRAGTPPPAAKQVEKKIPAEGAAGPLPLWVYILAICAFIVVIALLFIRLAG